MTRVDGTFLRMPYSWAPMPRRIYKERDQLNQRVAALLASGADEGAQKQLPAALAQLRANLSSEMRAWSEQHFLLFRMLLSPTQVRPCSIVFEAVDWPHALCVHVAWAAQRLTAFEHKELRSTWCSGAFLHPCQGALLTLALTFQGAWLLVESFPMHCDCLAFFNGLQVAVPQQ